MVAALGVKSEAPGVGAHEVGQAQKRLQLFGFVVF